MGLSALIFCMAALFIFVNQYVYYGSLAFFALSVVLAFLMAKKRTKAALCILAVLSVMELLFGLYMLALC